jgi:hypothetical protein
MLAVATAAGAVLAAALIPLAGAPAAGADPAAVGDAVTADQFSDLLTGEGTQADQAVDNFYQGIANFFAPEAMGNAATADLLGMSTGEGTQADQAVDNFLQGIANFFPPEVDEGGIFDPDAGFCGTLFSCLPEAPGDQMIDSLYLAINTAFQPEGPIDVFLQSLLGIA